jgi:hypothetical protein
MNLLRGCEFDLYAVDKIVLDLLTFGLLLTYVFSQLMDDKYISFQINDGLVSCRIRMHVTQTKKIEIPNFVIEARNIHV